MRLKDFDNETVFVDSNIFIYHLLGNEQFGGNCTLFLDKIEKGSILAYTSSLVIDEVYYAIVISKGAEILQTKRIKTVQEKLKTDSVLTEKCYDEVFVFQDYLDALEGKGLMIVNVTGKTLRAAISIAKK